MTNLYWDAIRKEIRSYDIGKLSPQQRANVVYLQGLISNEYARGLARGIEIGRREAIQSQNTVDKTRDLV